MGKIEIIAEIGKNFVITKEEESPEVLLERAKTLILEAKKVGADVCKFQVHNVGDEIHSEAKITSPHFDQDRYEWVKRNTYPIEFWREIKNYCDEIGIEFLATPMSKGSAILLENLGVKRWKVGSGDILDFPMLDFIRNTGKPIIVSSGMSTIQELKLAYDYLAEKVKDITILHCVSNYPCKLENLNLLTIPFLKKQFPKAKIGFSDHSLEISTGAMAVSLGAVVVEKHFTLSRKAWGSDHQVSLEPSEFKQMAKEIRFTRFDLERRELNEKGFIVEDYKNETKLRRRKFGEPLQPIIKIPKEALGVETKFINENEIKFRPIFRKGLYASQDIKQGEIWHNDMIISLRPRLDGVEPSENYPQFLGKIVNRHYKQYEPLSLEGIHA